MLSGFDAENSELSMVVTYKIKNTTYMWSAKLRIHKGSHIIILL